MATQYTLDLALATGATDPALQSVINYLNPSIAALPPDALAEFQQQLLSLTGSGTGKVDLTDVKVDVHSTPNNPLFDIAFTGQSNEVLQAGDGRDTITGAAGDTIFGSTSYTGAAKLYAGAGAEVLYGGAGKDTLYAGSGNDTLIGGAGNQSLYGSTKFSGHALLEAGSGDQQVYGGVGNDTVVAGAGHDTVYGGSGATTFQVSAANFNNDLFSGGTGKTTLDLTNLNPTDVHVATKNGVTTVDFGGSTLTLKGVNEIDFANHTKLTLQ